MGNAGMYKYIFSVISVPNGLGCAGVGKTSLVQRYTTNSFNSAKTAATAGAAFHVKKTVVNGVTVRLQLWDTAGQERFRSLVRAVPP